MQWGEHAYKLAERFSDESSNLETIAFSWFYQGRERILVANADFYYVAWMFVACLCYMCFHMESVFLAFVSLLHVAMSIPVALVIYRYVLGITYWSNPHVSVLIVIIGVGADDIFVFHDIWKGSFAAFPD